MPWTYGIHPVEALLERVPETVMEVWLVRSNRPGEARRRVRDLAEGGGVRFRLVTDQQLRAVVGDVTHQGVAARVSEFQYADEERLLAEPGPGMLIVLDEVQDPQNLGSVLRSAHAFGARGVIIPRHRAASVTPAVQKVAAGASAGIAVARVTNLSRYLEAAREQDYWIYGAVVEGGAPAWATAFSSRAVLVMGSERSGIRPSVLERCDVHVTLPAGGMESLNVAVASGVMMYEWRRQVEAGAA